MVSRENAVIVTSLLVALAVGAGLVQYTDAPSWVAMAVFIVLGVVVPTAINESSRRDRGVEQTARVCGGDSSRSTGKAAVVAGP